MHSFVTRGIDWWGHTDQDQLPWSLMVLQLYPGHASSSIVQPRTSANTRIAPLDVSRMCMRMCGHLRPGRRVWALAIVRIGLALRTCRHDSGIRTYIGSSATTFASRAGSKMRCYKSRDSSGPRRPDPSATASRRAGGTAERAAAGFSLDVTTSLDSDLRTPHYIIRSYILRTISPDHLPSRFRRGTSLGLGSQHIAAATGLGPRAWLSCHLPRTARPRAGAARAESGRARAGSRGAPDARGGPT